MGRGVTNLTAVKLGLATLRSRHGARHLPGPRGDRSAGRALPHACSRELEDFQKEIVREQRRGIVGLQPGRGGDPRGSLRRAHDPRQGRSRVLDGQRPWLAPRPAHRAVRPRGGLIRAGMMRTPPAVRLRTSLRSSPIKRKSRSCQRGNGTATQLPARPSTVAIHGSGSAQHWG
jgi:hypothetical protein